MKYILSFFATFALYTACTDFSLKDQGYKNLVPLPESVSFDGDGDNVDLEKTDLKEGESFTTLYVEAPSGTEKDIEVIYQLSGSAEYGIDYTIDGNRINENVQPIEGTVTVVSARSDIINFDRGAIVVRAISDGVDEPDETIEIYLKSAVRDGEPVAVGRGGTEYSRKVTLTITGQTTPAAGN